MNNNRASRRRHLHPQDRVPGFTPQWSKKVVITRKTIVGEKQLRHDQPTKTRREANRSRKWQAIEVQGQ